MKGLEPSTFCMASASARSRPFAPVRSKRLFAELSLKRANGSEPERTPSLAILATDDEQACRSARTIKSVARRQIRTHKRQVLRTRRPTGLDRATLTWTRAHVKQQTATDRMSHRRGLRAWGRAGSPRLVPARRALVDDPVADDRLLRSARLLIQRLPAVGHRPATALRTDVEVTRPLMRAALAGDPDDTVSPLPAERLLFTALGTRNHMPDASGRRQPCVAGAPSSRKGRPAGSRRRAP